MEPYFFESLCSTESKKYRFQESSEQSHGFTCAPALYLQKKIILSAINDERINVQEVIGAVWDALPTELCIIRFSLFPGSENDSFVYKICQK